MSEPSAANLSAVAARLYVDAPLIRQKLQQWRPHICPFDVLIRFVPQQANVLDVGCGCGLFLLLLAESGRRVGGIGFDLSQYAVDIAWQAATHLKDVERAKAIEFQRLDAVGVWPAGPFDVVSIVDVMHHLDPKDQKSVFMKACAQTAPGGVVIYKDMCRAPFWRAQANRFHDLLVARQWIHYVDIATVEEWAAEAGFKTTHAQRINLYCYGHDLRVFARA